MYRRPQLSGSGFPGLRRKDFRDAGFRGSRHKNSGERGIRFLTRRDPDHRGSDGDDSRPSESPGPRVVAEEEDHRPGGQARSLQRQSFAWQLSAGAGYSLELFSPSGETVAVATVPADATKLAASDEVLHAWRLEESAAS